MNGGKNPEPPAVANLLSRDRASGCCIDFGDTAGGSDESRPKNIVGILPAILIRAGNSKRRLTVKADGSERLARTAIRH